MTDSLTQADFWPANPDESPAPRRTIREVLADGVTASVIKQLLRARHAEPVGAWAFFAEFIPGIGYASTGSDTRLDGWAMNVWPSNGYRTIAYEIKVSRGDFLREMKQPDKRAWALTFTDEFYFVAPRHLIAPGELPDDCGLIEVTRVTARGSYVVDDQLFNMRATKKPVLDRRPFKIRDRDQRPTWDLLAAVARRSCRAESSPLTPPTLTASADPS